MSFDFLKKIIVSHRNYCSSTSLCRPQYDQNGEKPLCICSINSYGPGCNLDRQCQMNAHQNPCRNGGVCFVDYHQQRLIDAYICRCPKYYHGSICQYPSVSLEINYAQQHESFIPLSDQIQAVVIQLFDFSPVEELLLRKQAVCRKQLPPHSIIVHDNKMLPIFGLIKLYFNKSTVHYHLLYTSSNATSSLNLTIRFNAENYCPHIHELFKLPNETDSSTCDFKTR